MNATDDGVPIFALVAVTPAVHPAAAGSGSANALSSSTAVAAPSIAVSTANAGPGQTVVNNTSVLNGQRVMGYSDTAVLPSSAAAATMVSSGGSGTSNNTSTSTSGAGGSAQAGPADREQLRSFQVLMPAVKVPSNRTTSYLCTHLVFPSDRKYHIARVAPVLNSSRLHHLLLYSCMGPHAPRRALYDCLSMDANCQTAVAGEAQGL